MFEILFAFLNDVVPLSTTSMAFSKALLVHFPNQLIILHLLTICHFLVFSSPKRGWTFFLSIVGLFSNHVRLYYI